MPLFSVQDIPVIGQIIGAITQRKEEEEAYRKVLNDEPLTPRDVGLFLNYGVRHGLFPAERIPEEWHAYRNLAYTSPSLFGRAAEDVKRKAVSVGTAGLLDKIVGQPEAAPEVSGATGAAGTVAGTLATLPLFARLAGTGGLLSRTARMAATGAAVEGAKSAIEGEQVGAGAARGALLYGGTEAIAAPIINALLKRIGVTEEPVRAAAKRYSEGLPKHAAESGVLPEDIKSREPLIKGVKVGRGVAEALEKTTGERRSAEQQRLVNVLKQVLEKRAGEASGQYRAVGPGVPEPPIVVSPEGVAVPVTRLSETAAVSPALRRPQRGISGLLPPAGETAALPRPRLALPEGRVTVPEQELRDLAELKQAAAFRLHETMINDVRPEALARWEAAGRPQGRLEDFVREVARARGYDYDRIVADIGKPLEEHVAELLDIANLGVTAGVAPEARSAADVVRILRSVAPRQVPRAEAAPTGPVIETAGAMTPRPREVDEMLRYLAATPKRTTGAPLGAGRVLGVPTAEEIAAMPTRRVVIPAAERVPLEPPEIVTAPAAFEPIRESEMILRRGGQLPSREELISALRELTAGRATAEIPGRTTLPRASKPKAKGKRTPWWRKQSK